MKAKSGLDLSWWKVEVRESIQMKIKLPKLYLCRFSEERIFSKSLLSLTKLEKKLGKKVFEETIGDLIIKPPGKLQLVPEEDKRPAIRSSAEIDFKEEF